MKQIEINNSKDFREKSWELENEKDNQIILSLLDSVEHFHAIRFPKKKIICTSNFNEKEISYLIEILPLLDSEPYGDRCNETSFFFGGDDNSLYQFSNINIKAFVKKPFLFIDGTDTQVFKDNNTNAEGEGEIKVIEISNLDDLPCSELLFMKIAHDSKLTFFNCVFHNNTNKNYIIETWHNAVVEFINCEFRGNFIFKSNHDSIIVRH